jgi:hypothetical protein
MATLTYRLGPAPRSDPRPVGHLFGELDEVFEVAAQRVQYGVGTSDTFIVLIILVVDRSVAATRRHWAGTPGYQNTAR